MPASTGNHFADGILVAAAIVAALLVLTKATWAVIKAIASAVRFTDEVRAELRPNHGSSLRDAVDRIEAEQQKLVGLQIAQTKLQAAQAQDLTDLKTRLDEHLAEGDG